MANKERNLTLDVCRVIFALLVILVHYGHGMVVMTIANSFGRLAVPFFMMTTGFYFFAEQPTSFRVKRTVQKMMGMLGFWMLLYLPYAMVTYQHMSVAKLVASIIRTFFGINMFMGPAWYIWAMVVGLVAVSWFAVHNWMRQAAVISLLFGAIAVLTTSYGGWLVTLSPTLASVIAFVYPACSIITGFAWLTMAYYARGWFDRYKLAQADWILTAWLIGAIVLVGETLLIESAGLAFKTYTDMLFSLPVMALLTVWLIQSKGKLTTDVRLTRLLRRASVLLFFWQVYAGALAKWVMTRGLGVDQYVLTVWFSLIFTVSYLVAVHLTDAKALKIGLGE